MSNVENEFFVSLAKQALRDSNAPPEDLKADERFTWALIGILAFVGVEAVKVTLRNNFGRNGISLIRLFICALCFLGLSAFCFYYNGQPPEQTDSIGLTASFLPAAIFHILFAAFIVVRGVRLYTKANQSSKQDRLDDCFPLLSSIMSAKPADHKGDSQLLSFLKKDGISENIIQNVAEPVLFIAIGVSLSFINLLWGVPVAFCGLSVWMHQIMKLLFFNKPMEQNLAELQSRQQPDNQFHKIS